MKVCWQTCTIIPAALRQFSSVSHTHTHTKLYCRPPAVFEEHWMASHPIKSCIIFSFFLPNALYRFKKARCHATLGWENLHSMYSLCRLCCSVWWKAVRTLSWWSSASLSIMLSKYSPLTFDRWIFAWHLTQKKMTLSTLYVCSCCFRCMNLT